MEIKIFYIYCFIVNIIIVYCYEIDDLINFINNNIIPYNLTCNNDFIKCNNEHIVEISLNFSEVKSKVDVIDYSQFPKLPELKKLEFYGDLYNGIFPKTFLDANYFPNLEYLYLQEGNISEIPEIENSKSPVNEIILSLNQITKFPYQFKNLEKLKKLNLENNKISSLDNLGAKCNLEELSVGNNEIDTIPPDFFKDMPALKKLNLSSNKIKELPISLYRLQNLKEFDISNNTQLNAQITSFDSKISKCNFINTTIDCYDVGVCSIIDDDNNQNQYKTCPEEVIDKIKGNKKKNIITIIVFAVISIIVSIVGFLWIKKSNEKRKNAREADIDVSLTLKPSNIYSTDVVSSKNNDNYDQNGRSNFNCNNTQTSFERILPGSLTSSSPSLAPARTSTSLNSNVQSSNMDRSNSNSFSLNNQNQNVKNSIIFNTTGTTVSTNQIVNSQPNLDNSFIFAGNTSNVSIINPMLSPIPVSHTSTINNLSLQSPIPISQTSTINNLSLQSPIPVSQTSTINNVTLPSPNFVHFNGPTGLVNGPMNMSLINNDKKNLVNNNTDNKFMYNQSDISFVNGSQTNGQVITALPFTIRSNSSNLNYYNYELMNKINMAGFSSSSSSNNYNDNDRNALLTTNNDLVPEQNDDDIIRYKKKILQEEELINKYNNNNNNDRDPNNNNDNNLPPYSQF